MSLQNLTITEKRFNKNGDSVKNYYVFFIKATL